MRLSVVQWLNDADHYLTCWNSPWLMLHCVVSLLWRGQEFCLKSWTRVLITGVCKTAALHWIYKKTIMMPVLLLQEYPSDTLYRHPPHPHTTWWHFYEAWQSDRRSGEEGRLQDTLEMLSVSLGLRRPGIGLSLTMLTFVCFPNKSSTCHVTLTWLTSCKGTHPSSCSVNTCLHSLQEDHSMKSVAIR